MTKWNKNTNYVRKWYGKILHIFEPVFRVNIYWIKAKTEKEYKSIYEKQFNLPYTGNLKDGKMCVLEQNGTPVIVLWANDEVNISHECLHATFWILKEHGVILSEESEEIFCYLQGFLLRAILNK
mgnify:CR=1 FL=1